MIYIIGIGRSGSTLLTKTLNRHVQIKAIPEIPVFLFFANKYKHIRGKNQNLEDEVTSYLNLIQKTRPIEQVDITSNNSFKLKDYNSYYDFTLELFSNFKVEDKVGNHDIYVDKNPPYSLFINKIIKLDKDAKFIVLVRDPRDNVLSRKKKINNKPGHIAYNSFRYRFFYNKIQAFSENKKFHFLKYEDFVKEPENSINSVLAFIGVKGRLNKLKFNSKNSNFKIDNKTLENFANDHFKDLDLPIHEGHVQKWKEELSNKENKMIESITKPYLDYYNYHPSQKSKSYFYFVVCNLKWYFLAKWHINKEYLIYYSPTKVKLWRIKSMLSK